jgi:hypothetical protein
VVAEQLPEHIHPRDLIRIEGGHQFQKLPNKVVIVDRWLMIFTIIHELDEDRLEKSNWNMVRRSARTIAKVLLLVLLYRKCGLFYTS